VDLEIRQKPFEQQIIRMDLKHTGTGMVRFCRLTSQHLHITCTVRQQKHSKNEQKKRKKKVAALFFLKVQSTWMFKLFQLKLH